MGFDRRILLPIAASSSNWGRPVPSKTRLRELFFDANHLYAAPTELSVLYRCAALARALAASTSRVRGEVFVTSEASSVCAASEISSTAVSKAASFALEGLVKPLILRTNLR